MRIDPIAGDRRDPSLVRAGRIAEWQAREALKNREDNAFLA